MLPSEFLLANKMKMRFLVLLYYCIINCVMDCFNQDKKNLLIPTSLFDEKNELASKFFFAN